MNLNDIPFEDEVKAVADKAMAKTESHSEIPFEDEVDDGGGIPFEDEKDGDYGVLQRQRDTVVSQTGDATTDKGTAFLQNVLPGALNEAKKERDFQLSNLERLRSGSAMKEISDLREHGRVGVKEKHRNEGRLRHGIAGEISDIGAGGIAETQEGIEMLREAGNGSAWEGFKKGLSEIFGGEKTPEPTDEEREKSYFDKMESIAKNAGIDEKRIGELRESAKTIEDFAEGLRGEVVKSLTDVAKNRKEASERLQKFKASTTDSILNGLVTNSGYTGGFILASMTGPMGYAALIGDSADQRIKELRQADYDVTPDGDLVVKHNEESAGSAVAKGIVGGAVEVGVEIALEKGLGWIFNGMNIPVGQGVKKALAPWLGKATETVAKGVSKPVKALGRAMSKNPAGKWLVGAAEGFGKYSQITGVHSIPMEMLEEHVQSFADDVLGLGVKSREHGGFGSEAKDWWNNKFWNYETNRDIFLGLVGTMAVQGPYAGTKAHHDIKKWRQNPSGYLKTMIDPKKVDALSDEEVAHLYKFVTSPNFTKDRVERFLQHVQGQTELANALLQLKEANTPFFETDKDALKQAVESGSIKSQFVPPTRESGMGTGQQVDWQPHVWKDGRRTMRAYDPNTGIAIDQIGGQNNRLVVTNRDGTRIEVGADESGDAFAKAMEIADRMSIHNQLLDMKRPMKQAYVESRIEALFPKGDFYILANNAELVETFPGIEKTRDYSPQNPAFTTSDGKVVVVLDNLKSAYEANRVILHEAAIHSGLKGEFTTDAKRKFLRSIDDPSVNSMTERLMNIRGVNSVDELSDEDREEAFAHTWDRRRTSPTLAQKASHALREMARAVKLPVSYNTSDLEVMVDTLQREGQSGRGTVEKSTFDTTEHTKGVPYNEAQRDFSGDVADVSKPSENTPEKEAVRKMERLDRIKQNHPRMWEYAMRVNDNDEDAAADFIAKALEEEGMRGVAGEAERGFDALEAAAKLENGEDLTPADLKILDEHGFTGQVLYTDYGYRKQKNGVWKRVVAPETTNKQEKPDETGTGTDETPAQPESGTQRPAEPEVAGTEKGGASGEEANGVVNGEGTKQGTKLGTKLGTKSEGSTEPMSENRFWNVMHRRGDRRRVPLDTIKIPDTQFKEDADPKTGVVPGHEIHEYYENAENPITLYERLDGSLELVTGRHRVDGAKRSGLKDIDARIFREADGYTPEDMKLYDAVANILDEKGTVKDYVRFFEESGFGEEDARATGILSTTKGRMAFGIYKDASGDTRSAIDRKGSGGEGLISVEQAGIIAEAAPRDAHPRNAAVQRVLVRRALDGVRGKKLAILARTLAEEVKTRKETPKTEGNTQLDLFTSEEDVALLEQEERRADYRAKKANDYKRIAEVLRTALRKGGRLDLNKGYAKELGITDPKDKRQLEVARDKAVERANYWENAVRLDDEDKAVMDRELGIETPKPKPKPKAGADDFSQKVVDAIDVDARDGLINVHADNRFGDGAYFASYAAGSEEEIKRAADGIRAAFPNMTVFTSEDGIAIVPKKETKPAPAENAMDRAKAAAEKHVVSYGNGMRGTLADMLANGNATLYPDKGLTAFDKGKPHVVTIGMEQFTPTKEELPYLIEVQRNYFKANPDQIPPSLRGMYSDIAPKTPKNTTVSAPAETPATTPPKATEAAQGGESASGDTIDLSDSLDDLGAMRWFSRSVEGYTDEEIQAHNMVLGVKIIKNFAAKGGKDFGQFARSVKAIAPEVYEHIKNQMPGMWLNAWMGGEKSLSVPQTDEYERILAATDAWKAPEKPVQKPQERTEQPKADNDTPKHKTRGEAISAAADEMIDLIRVDATQRKLTRKDMENVVAKHLGGSVAEGTFEMKDVTDIMELAVNRILKDDMFAPTDNPQQKITLIRRLLDRIPTQTTRSAEQDKMQQFSTVPHEAFAAAWVANITDADVMIEPSAGIGGIAVFAKNAGAEVILNELSERRREILEQLGLSPKVYGVNAEYLWSQFYGPVKKGEVKRPTVVVMNPPFSNSALTSRKDTIGVGGQHVEQALEMLAPGGRLVAIVGHGMAHDAESPKVRAWWKKIGEKYRIRADVTVNGDEYAKYGTTYDNNIIVIDKVAPDSQIKPVYGKIESIDDLPAMLEGVRNDRPAIQSEKVAEKPNGGSPATGTSGGASTGQRDDGGRNGVQSGNGGNGSAQPPRKPSGRTGGRVPGAREDGGRGNRTEPVRGVEPTVTGGLTTVNAAGGATSKETSPQEVGDGTFSTYKPAKVKIEGAKPHPTALVESTAMASVLPPDPTYSPILPKKAIEGGMPSDAQLEQIVYAGQAHEQILPNGQRRGYFFGDGTGLGKGTEIGGVISDNWNHGRRKAVWVSKESGLMRDAMRDLVTYGLDGQIFDFNPKKKSVTSRDMGIAFLSYDGLKQDCVFDTQGNVRSAKQGQKNRFQHLVEWLGKDFDGVIVFDEAHKAGNAVTTRGKRGAKPPAKQALAVVALQEALPNARILYVSATGATEVSNLSYATRLGLWGKGTAFRDREDFINRVSSGGLSVMEIVARDMKSMGVYMARSLSYDGIVNRKIEHALSPDQKRKYDEMADAWQMVIRSVGEALISTGGAGNSNAVSAAMSALWGGEQRFFNQLLTAMQMPSIIADAKKQLEAGNSVVFQLVNTNEATQKRAIEEQRQRDGEVNAEELDLSPRDIIIGYVRNSFPVTQYVEQEDEDGNTQWVIMTDAEGNPVENPIAVEARDNLLERLNMMKLDDNPLELIIDEFGAENVAEVTGRSRRRQMVRNDDGEMEMKLVSRSKKQGLIETDEFNAGKRRVLVFSDAGGTGRSFHADKRFGNQQKRIHYLVQAGWRADSALQGFGRTHRSNEALPPEYVLCSTDIRGHQRFISTVARRLAQLGSLTAGDRSSAGGGVFSEDDNLENQYAENALHDLFMDKFRNDRTEFTAICRQLGFVKQTMNRRTGEVEEVNQLLDKDGDLDTTRLTIPTFLNRILNMRVDAQNKLFDEFMDVMRDHIEAAKENGTFDPGLEKLQGDKIEELNRTELWSGGKGTGSTDIVEVGVSKKSRKVDYETVLARMQRAADGRNWFFARNLNSGKIFGFAETSRAKTLQSGAVVNQLRCFSPDGKAPLVLETDVRFDGPHVNFTRISEREAVELWGNALAEIPDLDTTKRYFVHGTMLPIWDRLAVQNPRIFRIAPNEGGSFLGMEVKAENVNDLLKRFGKAAQSVELTPERC